MHQSLARQRVEIVELVEQAPVVVAEDGTDPERRAKLLAFVEASTQMPAETKARFTAQLQEDEVPAAVVERLESRMGG